MFKLALIFGILALVAAILGFGGMAGALADIAIIIFVIALIVTALFLFLGWRAAQSVIGSR